MARLIGVDVRGSHLRVAVLRTRYRSLFVDAMRELDLRHVGSLDEALSRALEGEAQHGEPIAVAIDGEHSFIHRLMLPPTASRQVDEIVPFELEAQLPVDFSEVVFDYKRLPQTGDEPLVLLAGAARVDDVRGRLALVERAVGREPERVGCGPLSLANLTQLAPELVTDTPIAMVDLGGVRTEVVILLGGRAVFARTLSRGVEGLPDTAHALAAELRQTFLGWLSQGGAPVERMHLVGGGAEAQGASAFLAAELGLAVHPLPALRIEGLSQEDELALPRFAKAIALGLSFQNRGGDIDLRRGPLAYQRGYGFLKEKVPLLTGLAVAIVISFAFSTWAELRALAREHTILTNTLADVSATVLGQELTDPAEVDLLLDDDASGKNADPMPHADAFDVVVAISQAVPMSVTHDIAEFDFAREHVKVRGIVDTTENAQSIVSKLADNECFHDAKITKINQVVNSDRQKYVMEFDVLCPEDGPPDSRGSRKKKSSRKDDK